MEQLARRQGTTQDLDRLSEKPPGKGVCSLLDPALRQALVPEPQFAGAAVFCMSNQVDVHGSTYAGRGASRCAIRRNPSRSTQTSRTRMTPLEVPSSQF